MPTQLPRVSVIVTEEQLALLSELASLDPQTRSVSGFIRQLVDQVTPLLRVSVPAMRAAVREQDSVSERLRVPLRGLLREAEQQLDLLDKPGALGAPATQRSEDGRTKRRASRK